MKASIHAMILSLSSAFAMPVADAEAEAAPAQSYGTYPNYGRPTLILRRGVADLITTGSYGKYQNYPSKYSKYTSYKREVEAEAQPAPAQSYGSYPSYGMKR